MASSPSTDNAHASASASGRGRRLSRLLLLGKEDRRNLPSEQNPLLVSPPRPQIGDKKKSIASVAFWGLGCTSSSASQVYTPAAAAVRSSADWQAKRSRTKRKKSKAKRKDRDHLQHQHQQPPQRKNQMAAADIWCAPGYAFSAVADASVDCVVTQQRPLMVRGRASNSERIERERACIARRSSNQEQLSSLLDSPQFTQEAPLFGSDIIPQGHFLHSNGFHNSPGGLEEILMFQTRLLLGRMDVYDRYRDLRLDVDSMSYEELLELGDRIGYVNTGLREEEILCCLRKMKHSIFEVRPLHFSSEMECKCSICQEEFEVNEEVGKLDCGHSYHMYCIKQWLLQKKVCPVCKSAVARN